MPVVLLTGVTGNLGCETLVELIENTSCNVAVIVRGSSYFEAQSRVEQVGMVLGLREQDLTERVKIYVGDLEQPDLGLAPEQYRDLSEQTNVIIHTAAALSLKLSYVDAKERTLVPTQRILDFAERCVQLTQFVLVSTVGVGGADYPLLPEIYPLEPKSFRNNYERVKFESEREVCTRLSSKVPVTLLRPSMIVGTSKNGRVLKPQIFSAICQLLTGSLTDGLIPDLRDFHLDTIPVDVVARSIRLLLESVRAEQITVLHLCSGAERWISFSELEQEIFRVVGQPEVNRRNVPVEEFCATYPLLLDLLADKDRKRLAFVPFFLDYFAFDQAFENVRTRQFLSERGLTIPPALEYLPLSISTLFGAAKGRRNLTVLQRRSGMLKAVGGE